MMTTIKLTVSGAHVTAQPDGPLTSGMVGLPVVISYDSSWDGLTKTLVCRSSMGTAALDLTYIQANIGTRATVAPEVMLAHRHLYLGIEGRTADGTLVVPTIWADCGIIQPGAESSGTESQEVTPEVWAQLASQIGTLEDLQTSHKDTIVTAINSLAQDEQEALDALTQQVSQAMELGNENARNINAAMEEASSVIQEIQDEFLAFSQGSQVTHEALAQQVRQAMELGNENAENITAAMETADSVIRQIQTSQEDLAHQISQVEEQSNRNADNISAAIQEAGTVIQQLQDQLTADIRALEEEMDRIPESAIGPEPGDEDIPQIYLEGTIPTGLKQTQATMNYASKTDSFTAYLLLSCADDPSLTQGKKSYAIRMFTNAGRAAKLFKSFRDWGYASHTYVLRANFMDHSHARNIVSSRLWSDVMASRDDYNTLPTQLQESPRNGAADGFPVKLYLNGSYQGLYTWNMDEERWNMSSDDQGVLRALTNSTADQPDTPCNFRTLWSGTSGDHWALETNTGADLTESLNNLISFVRDSDDDQFRTSIGQHLDLTSAMDYYLFQFAICGVDALGKNLRLATYDGAKWFCGCGDLDAVFLLDHDGSSFVPKTTNCPKDYRESGSLLWARLVALFPQELKARYQQLRSGPLSFPNVCGHFERFTDAIGREDYQEDVEIFPSIPLADSNNIRQIRNAIRDRLSYCDRAIEKLDQAPIDYSLNPLADVEWYDDTHYENGELAPKTGEHCTSRFRLQDCLYRLSYSSGVYHTLYIWDKDDNYLGHVETQLTYFTGRSDFIYAFRVNQPNNFSSGGFSIMPVNNEETAAEPFTLNLADMDFTTSGSAIHVPVSNYFGLESFSTAAIASRIHHSDALITIGSSHTVPSGIDPEKLTVGSFYVTSQQIHFGTRLYGNGVATAKAYFAEHDTTVRINP